MRCNLSLGKRVGQCLHFVFSLSVVIAVHYWLADSLSQLSVCLATLVLTAAHSLPSVSKHSELFHPFEQKAKLPFMENQAADLCFGASMPVPNFRFEPVTYLQTASPGNKLLGRVSPLVYKDGKSHRTHTHVHTHTHTHTLTHWPR